MLVSCQLHIQVALFSGKRHTVTLRESPNTPLNTLVLKRKIRIHVENWPLSSNLNPLILIFHIIFLAVM